MSQKLPEEMDSLKVPHRIQKMDASTPIKDTMSDTSSAGGGGLGYQNTLVSIFYRLHGHVIPNC